MVTEGSVNSGNYIFIDNLSIGASTTENFIADINVLANDTSVDVSDVLTVVAVGTRETIGLVTLNPDGTVNYNPNGQFEFLSTRT